jgi:hypothetical protein
MLLDAGPSIAESGGEPYGTVPELPFEKRELVPASQQFLVSHHA